MISPPYSIIDILIVQQSLISLLNCDFKKIGFAILQLQNHLNLKILVPTPHNTLSDMTSDIKSDMTSDMPSNMTTNMTYDMTTDMTSDNNKHIAILLLQHLPCLIFRRQDSVSKRAQNK